MYECRSVLIFFEGLDCFGSKESRNDDLGRGGGKLNDGNGEREKRRRERREEKRRGGKVG